MKNFNLPKDYHPYIDKYFLRAKTILEKDGLNPVVKYQVFIRRGNCKVYGIDEAIAIITKYCKDKDLKIWSLKEGDYFENGECLMIIEGRIQDLIDLETMYLGVLSAETTMREEGGIDLDEIEENMRKIVELIKPKPVSYFGARHWRYDWDWAISGACYAAGAKNCSTDEGATNWGEDEKGIGTIPHSLESIYHWKYGLENAVYITTYHFDKWIERNIPQIALVDYANQEIRDSLTVAPIVQGIRIDTCGENYIQGVMPGKDDKICIWGGVCRNAFDYIFNKGVSVYGVYIIRKLLNDSGFENVKIILSSGFGNPEKVNMFVETEKLLGMKLFDALGVGGVFESRMATADIIEVGGKEIHKVGRMPKDACRLKRVI